MAGGPRPRAGPPGGPGPVGRERRGQLRRMGAEEEGAGDGGGRGRRPARRRGGGLPVLPCRLAPPCQCRADRAAGRREFLRHLYKLP